jgi:CubicO group peptidase (beta-lactamase class C family)
MNTDVQQPLIDQPDLLAKVGAILQDSSAVALAVGVVRNGSLPFFSGDGLADVALQSPITEDTVFRIASITKTFTAIAVMQLWEQGLVDLDAPANEYLHTYKLIPAKASFRPASVRHLLAHTAGIREVLHLSGLLRMRDLGETVPLGRPVPSLAEYYHGGLRIDAEPGTRFMYSNHGFATLGQIVEDVSGEPLDRYFREHLFAPLGMENTDLKRSERGTGGRDHPGHAHGHCRQRVGTACCCPSRGYRRRSSSGSSDNRTAVPRGPLSGCRVDA